MTGSISPLRTDRSTSAHISKNWPTATVLDVQLWRIYDHHITWRAYLKSNILHLNKLTIWSLFSTRTLTWNVWYMFLGNNSIEIFIFFKNIFNFHSDRTATILCVDVTFLNGCNYLFCISKFKNVSVNIRITYQLKVCSLTLRIISQLVNPSHSLTISQAWIAIRGNPNWFADEVRKKINCIDTHNRTSNAVLWSW